MVGLLLYAGSCKKSDGHQNSKTAVVFVHLVTKRYTEHDHGRQGASLSLSIAKMYSDRLQRLSNCDSRAMMRDAKQQFQMVRYFW